MTDQADRARLTRAEAGLLYEVLGGRPPLLMTAYRVANGEIVSREAAEAMVDVLTEVLLDDEGHVRGEIDDLIGPVLQATDEFWQE